MISLEKAKKALELSEEKARELGIKVTTVVVDEHGVPVALSKMDGAFHISPKFAQMKAYTSAVLRIPSGEIAPFAAEGKPFYGVQEAFAQELITLPGGVPVKEGSKIIGGIGVGGSMDVSEDLECAQNALKAFS
jgi:uncharacterized protein GlcG (DUF336 family)